MSSMPEIEFFGRLKKNTFHHFIVDNSIMMIISFSEKIKSTSIFFWLK